MRQATGGDQKGSPSRLLEKASLEKHDHESTAGAAAPWWRSTWPLCQVCMQGPGIELDQAQDAEILGEEKAFPKLSNGKATGKAGWPAELLRHATYHIQLEDGRRVNVWMLAPILAAFLTACFMQGRLPACVSSALVTPVHKKGAVADLPLTGPLQMGSRCTGCTPSF